MPESIGTKFLNILCLDNFDTVENDGLLKYVSWEGKGEGLKYFLNSSNYRAEMLELKC